MNKAKSDPYNIKDLYPNNGLLNSIFGISYYSVYGTNYLLFLSYKMLEIAPITISITAIKDVLSK